MTDGITISFGLKEKVTIFLFTIFGILSKHGMTALSQERIPDLKVLLMPLIIIIKILIYGY